MEKAKKKLLFSMNHLDCGGAEKALLSLLSCVDYDEYEVDVMLFAHRGAWLHELPREVRLLDEPEHYEVFDMPIMKALRQCAVQRRWPSLLARIRAGIVFRTERNPAKCEQRIWKYIAHTLPTPAEHYDVAIGYLEKTPIYYTVDQVNATKKIGFIHTDYDQLGMDPQHDEYYFGRLDHVVTVSDVCADVLRTRFPRYAAKIAVLHNIVSPEWIRDRAADQVTFASQQITIVSVGRLHPVKGFDMAIEACERLIRDGYDLRWYIIGEGNERPHLEQGIRARQLQNHFQLLGLKTNPYPYIKQCDIYVQTSHYEGSGITLTEAKALHKPIVSTDFTAVYEQIAHERNGLIVAREANAIYAGIKRLIEQPALRAHFQKQLEKEEISTVTEMRKFYDMCL